MEGREGKEGERGERGRVAGEEELIKMERE